MEGSESLVKHKKKILVVLAISAVILLAFVGGQAYAKYVTEVKGEGIAEVATWDFKVNGQKEHVQQIKLASTYDNKKAYVLHDLKEKKDIIYVAKYKNYKKDNTVYIIGKRNIEDSNYIYGVLNYKTKQYNSYDTFDSLPDSIKPIFQQQEDFNFYVNTPY